MRKLAPLGLLVLSACTITTPPPRPATPSQAGAYGLTVEEEGRILALEDRREWDPALAAAWATHPNPVHRQRLALALGRIGPHTFIDTNANGVQDAGENQAGVAELIELAADADPVVREAVAFALGEIGDPVGTEALFTLAGDSDAGIAAEAAEALSKLASRPEWRAQNEARYLALIAEERPAGVRARALRFTFRFDSDTASAAAVQALGSNSSVIRQEAAYSLSRRAFAPARAQLELLLTDPESLTRAYAVAALGRIGDAASAPLLVNTLADIHPWVRTNAAVGIGRIAEKNMAVIRGDDLPRIFAATEDPDAGVRASAIELLGYYAAANAPARERLLSIAENGTRSDRDLAIVAFLKRLPAHADAELRRTSKPDSERTAVYQQYLNRLMPLASTWGKARAVEALATIYPAVFSYATDADATLRAAAVGAYPDTYVDNVREQLRTLIAEDSDVIVRASAIDRYSHVKADDESVHVETLRAAEQRERSSDMNDARLAAINALADIAFPERAAFFSALAGDTDPVVRRVASDIIATKLGMSRPQYTPLPVNRTAGEYEEIVRWSHQPHKATIHMSRGNIELALLTQDAPMTAWNFAQLAQRKYFDDTSFMRVVPNFVIQGGDPRNDMNGGPGYSIRDEINLQKYTRGAVGMALSGPDTGGSQFFITHSPQPHLDGGYTIFGRVTEGMSGVVDQTERGDRVETITIDEQPQP